MERRRFGNTDLMVSTIGLGCYGMSGASRRRALRPAHVTRKDRWTDLTDDAASRD